jgi:hypothetical protein
MDVKYGRSSFALLMCCRQLNQWDFLQTESLLDHLFGKSGSIFMQMNEFHYYFCNRSLSVRNDVTWVETPFVQLLAASTAE